MRRRKIDPEKLFTVIKNLVRAAEELFGPEDGETKKEWVVKQVNDLVNIPFLGEKAEAVLIGVLIDFVVAVFNEAKEQWEA